MKAAFLNSLKGETEFWEDLCQLGLAMLENYYTWALKVDNFSVQATEEIFTRRIPWRNDYDMDLHEVFSNSCLLYTSPSPRDRQKSRMPSSA